jgi:hypothetical protein
MKTTIVIGLAVALAFTATAATPATLDRPAATVASQAPDGPASATPLASEEAPPQSRWTLDADADGMAEDTRTGMVSMLELEIDGSVIVTDTDQGADRTAFGTPASLEVVVTVGDDEYRIPATLGGEGTSLVQTGVSSDAWRLSVQGTDRGAAQFRGSLILIGAEDGYALSGEGVLNVPGQADTTTYQLEYAGSAEFGP